MKKIGLGKKLFHMANALAHGVRPKRYECKFMAPGLTNYPGEDGTGEEMWYLSRNVMNKMQDSYIGCPVVAETKHDGGSSADNFKDVAVGVVSEVWTDNEGWDNAKFIVWDEEVQDAIENQGFNVSCAYNTTEFDPGGTLNAIDYDHEVTDAEYLHLAIVSAPRQTGARILINALDNENGGAIIFENSWRGKLSMFKLFPQGRKMMNANIKPGDLVEDEDGKRKIVSKVISDNLVEDEDGKRITVSKVLTSDDKKNAAPPGWEKTVEKMKGKPGIEEPFALAWWMKEKGYKPNGIEEDRDWEKWEGWGDYKASQTSKWDSLSADERKKVLKETGTSSSYASKSFKEIVAETPSGADAIEDYLKMNAKTNGAMADARKTALEAMRHGGSIDQAVDKAKGDQGLSQSEADELRKWIENRQINDKKKKEDEDMKKNKGIDLKNAVIETPNGDVKLEDMINAYEKSLKKNQDDELKDLKEDLKIAKEAGDEEAMGMIQKRIDGLTKKNDDDAELKKLEDELQKAEGEKAEQIQKKIDAILFAKKSEDDDKLSMDDEYEGVKVSAMYEAYKKNQEESEEEKKKKEAEAASAKKNQDRKDALKEEGKTDEEIEAIMKSEAEAIEKERKEKEDENALKSAEEDAEKAKKEAANKLNHFNSLANARHKKIEVPETIVITKSQKIKAAKNEY